MTTDPDRPVTGRECAVCGIDLPEGSGNLVPLGTLDPADPGWALDPDPLGAGVLLCDECATTPPAGGPGWTEPPLPGTHPEQAGPADGPLVCLWCGAGVDPLDDLGHRPDPDNPRATVCAACSDLAEAEQVGTLREGPTAVVAAAYGEPATSKQHDPGSVNGRTHNPADDPADLLAADHPPGDTYGREQAAQVLGVSARRVSQLAADGRLEVVQAKPLRVSAQSVHELRAERRGPGRDQRATVPPDPEGDVAAQIERVVSLVVTEHRRAIEAGEHLLAEVATQRDDYRAERDELRAERDRLRAELDTERQAREDHARTTQRRHWWHRGTP